MSASRISSNRIVHSNGHLRINGVSSKACIGSTWSVGTVGNWGRLGAPIKLDIVAPIFGSGLTVKVVEVLRLRGLKFGLQFVLKGIGSTDTSVSI
jgi:hypothetical protein